MNLSKLNSLAELMAGIREEDLARRLGVTGATLQTQRSKPDFQQWSKEQDPENVSWRYQQEKQRYIANLSFGNSGE